MKEPRKDEESQSPSQKAQDATTPPPASDPLPPAGLKYVFKIAKADPKNTFDFEDVADK
ncbi:MAG: hypothetical protein IT454_10525 [Planctomycetes bacterium]|nr:hypothetical protein [Planctomycetota bacterium]